MFIIYLTCMTPSFSFPKLPTKKKEGSASVNLSSIDFSKTMSSWLHDARLSCQCHQRHWPQYYPWPCSTSSPPPAEIPWKPWWIHGTDYGIFAYMYMNGWCFHDVRNVRCVRGARKHKNHCRHCQTMKILKFVFDGRKKVCKNTCYIQSFPPNTILYLGRFCSGSLVIKCQVCGICLDQNSLFHPILEHWRPRFLSQRHPQTSPMIFEAPQASNPPNKKIDKLRGLPPDDHNWKQKSMRSCHGCHWHSDLDVG